MAAVATERTPAPAPVAAARPRGRSVPVWRWVVMLIAAVYFLLPLYAALRFAGLHAFGSVVSQAGFGSALWLSVKLAVVTWAITMLLMIPTTVYVHLRLPGLRRLLETITILPIVVPPVVLIVGVLQVMPLALRSSVWLLAIEYVVLAMPFAYRALDAGLRSIDVKTLTEASGSLGAGPFTTLWRVLLPNLRTALLSAAPVIGDAVITGQDRDTVGALAWLNPAELPADLAGTWLSDGPVRYSPQLAEHLGALLTTLNSGQGSAGRIERLIVLAQPASLEDGEITDKGYVNQRRVLANRAALVELLYGDPVPEKVITPARKRSHAV